MTPHKAPDLTMKPHKATEHQWGIVRRRAKNDFPDSTDSVLLELAHRVAALESQHNLVVDNITDLQGCVNQLEAATQPPPPAADHSRGATEMVATDEELWSLWANRPREPLSAVNALRAIYNLGRQHAAQVRQEDQPLPLPAPVTTNPAAIGRFGEWLAREMPPGTVIGQPLHWAPQIVFAVLDACREVEPTPPPTPAGGLVEELASVWSDGKPLHPVACRHALRLVADWLDTRPIDCCSGITGLRGCAAELRQEVDQGRADG
jgi:hypothetical protein